MKTAVTEHPSQEAMEMKKKQAADLVSAWGFDKEAARVPKQVTVRWDLGDDQPEFGERDFKKALRKLRLPERVKIPQETLDLWEKENQDNDVIDQFLSDEYGYLHHGWKVASYYKCGSGCPCTRCTCKRQAQELEDQWSEKTATGKSQIWHLDNAKDLFVREAKRMGHKVSVREDTKESRRQVHDDGDERYYITIQLSTEWHAANPQPLSVILILKDGYLFVVSKHTIRRGIYTKTPKDMVQVALSQVDAQLYEMASEAFPREVVRDMHKTKTLTEKPDVAWDRNTGVYTYKGREIQF